MGAMVSRMGIVATEAGSPENVVAATKRARYQRFGPFRFDTVNRLLLRESNEIALPPRVLTLLECLLDRPGHVISRQELIELVWRDSFVTDTSLAEAISALRQALGDDPQRPAYLQTMHRRGYRFVAEVLPEPPPGEAASAGPSRPDEDRPTILQLAPWALVLLLGATLIVALWKLTHSPEARPPQVVTFDLSLPAGTALDWSASPLAASPDGRTIAFTVCGPDGSCLLHLRELAGRTSRPLEGSAGAAAPFFSPDGAWVGFFASGKLKKAPVSGGTPITICDAPDPLGASWLPGGRIVFAGHEGSGLEVVSDAGGAPAPFSTVDVRAGEFDHRWPHWLPGSGHVVFTATTVPGDGATMTAAAFALPDGPARTLTARASGARLIAPDLIAFARGDEIFAARFDAARGLLSTTPLRVGGPVGASADGAPVLASSAQGLLLRAEGNRKTPALAIRTADGRTEAPLAPLAAMADARLDPAGGRVAGAIGDGQRRDIWIAELSRGTAARLTHERLTAAPIWSGDGRAVIFSSRAAGGGPFNLWMADVDSGAARRLLEAAAHQLPSSSTEGRIIYTQYDPATKGDIWMTSLDSSRRTGEARPLVRTPFDERGGAVSADGRWLAYESDESGDWQVYLRPLRGGARAVVGPSPSRDARWIAGGALAYKSARHIVAVSVSVEGAIGPPRPLGDVQRWRFGDLGAGPTLLLHRPAAHVTQLVVTLEAREAIERIVPPALSAMPR
jgi:DNA-binding winged helix-turn-helix (wHTH) protein/Tol biopolymer transport system component